jgi:hypothetical protein
MHIVPAPLGFSYRMDYVPKGSRNVRSGVFRDKDVVGVRYIDVDEAQPAFRVRIPQLDIWPLVKPRTPRSNQWQLIRDARKFDILLNEGSLWWPIRNDSTYDNLNALDMTAAECLDRIENNYHFFDSAYGIERGVPEIRELVRTDRGDKVAQAQRKTAENILVFGNKAYARGGIPIFFRNSHGNKKVWEIDIASVGPDRSADPIADGLYYPPGSYTEGYTETALTAGEFWLVDDARSAASSAHPKQTAIPKIDVLMPQLVSDIRQQVRLDALFREVARMFRPPFCDQWRPGDNMLVLKNAFIERLDPKINDSELSRRRLGLLRQFASLASDIKHWEIDRIRQDFGSFDLIELSNPTWPNDLAPEDDNALGSLAD